MCPPVRSILDGLITDRGSFQGAHRARDGLHSLAQATDQVRPQGKAGRFLVLKPTLPVRSKTPPFLAVLQADHHADLRVWALPHHGVLPLLGRLTHVGDPAPGAGPRQFLSLPH